MFAELELVVLSVAMHEIGLEPGDVGTVVLVHEAGRAYEVEFVTLDGSTIAVETLRADQVRGVRGDEVMHARTTRTR